MSITPAVLHDIDSRLDRLERQIEQVIPPGEQLVPTYLTVSPTGTISANFSGVVTGSLVLPEAAALPPTTANAIEWTSNGTPGGTLFEWIQGANVNPGQHGLNMVAQDTGGAGDQASLTVQTQSGVSATVLAGANGPGGSPQVTLISDTSKSSFLRLPPGALKTQSLFGSITAAGATTGTSSGGFSVAHTATGVYTITFSSSFTDTGYAALVTLQGVGFAVVTTAGKLVSSMIVDTFNSAIAATDTAFSFIALGVAA